MLQTELDIPSSLPVRRAKPSASASAVSWECSLCSSSRTTMTRRKGRRRRRRKNNRLPLPQRAAKTETKTSVGTLYTGTDWSWPECVRVRVCVRMCRETWSNPRLSHHGRSTLISRMKRNLNMIFTLSWSTRTWLRADSSHCCYSTCYTRISPEQKTHSKTIDGSLWF